MGGRGEERKAICGCGRPWRVGAGWNLTGCCSHGSKWVSVCVRCFRSSRVVPCFYILQPKRSVVLRSQEWPTGSGGRRRGVVRSSGSVWFLLSTPNSTQTWMSQCRSLRWMFSPFHRSDYFRNFVDSCLQKIPQDRPTSEELLKVGLLVLCFPRHTGMVTFFCPTCSSRFHLPMLCQLSPLPLSWGVLQLSCPFAASGAVPQVILRAGSVLSIKEHSNKWHWMTISLSGVSVS